MGLTPVQQKAKTITDYIRAREHVVAKTPGEPLDMEGLVQTWANQVLTTPKLLECSPPTVLNALLTSRRLGLIPDGILGQGYLIPRWNAKTKQLECQFQPGYQGLMDLAWRSEKIARITPRLVFEHDEFHVSHGSEEALQHIPAGFNDRGEMVAVYCMVWLTTGAPPVFCVLSRQECEQLRDRVAPRDKSKNIVGPWRSDFEAMCMKTAIIRALKYCPKSTELARAVTLDEMADAGVSQPMHPEARNGNGTAPPEPTPEGPADPNASEEAGGEAGNSGGATAKCPDCKAPWEQIQRMGNHLPGCPNEEPPPEHYVEQEREA